MSVWVHKNGPVTIGVDRDALSFVLDGFAKDVNSVAAETAQRARDALPEPWMRNSIRFKKSGTIQPKNQGIWQLKMRGRRYGSGTGERLMRGVHVPVALVTNNSRLAMTWEYGAIPDKASVVFRRKGSTKAADARDYKGGDWETWNRQWGPLLTGARSVSRARLVERYRRSR